MLSQLDEQHRILSDGLRRRMNVVGVQGAGPPAFAFEADERVPVRTTRGPINGDYLDEHLSAEDLEWYESDANTLDSAAQFELHNFMDGKTGVTALRNALSAEFGPVDHDVVKRHVEMLVRTELAEWR